MPLPILLLRKRKLRHSLGKPSRSDFVQSELGIAFKKGTHEELAEKLAETLTEMQSEGITEKIVTKYGLDADETLPGGESK